MKVHVNTIEGSSSMSKPGVSGDVAVREHAEV